MQRIAMIAALVLAAAPLAPGRHSDAEQWARVVEASGAKVD
jgi:hypothetical protein